MSYKPYTGIGSREAPIEVLNEMTRCAAYLAKKKFVLRSGKAGGSDEYFQKGVERVGLDWQTKLLLDTDRKLAEIYTPWKDFHNEVLSSFWDIDSRSLDTAQEAQKIASEIHPNWNACKKGVRLLHSRNIFQVLGKNLDSPSLFVLYYAKEDRKGNVQGGTRTAVMCAREYGVPTVNMLFDGWKEKTWEIIDEITG